jgi:hypothetical protein
MRAEPRRTSFNEGDTGRLPTRSGGKCPAHVHQWVPSWSGSPVSQSIIGLNHLRKRLLLPANRCSQWKFGDCQRVEALSQASRRIETTSPANRREVLNFRVTLPQRKALVHHTKRDGTLEQQESFSDPIIMWECRSFTSKTRKCHEI